MLFFIQFFFLIFYKQKKTLFYNVRRVGSHDFHIINEHINKNQEFFGISNLNQRMEILSLFSQFQCRTTKKLRFSRVRQTFCTLAWMKGNEWMKKEIKKKNEIALGVQVIKISSFYYFGQIYDSCSTFYEN